MLSQILRTVSTYRGTSLDSTALSRPSPSESRVLSSLFESVAQNMRKHPLEDERVVTRGQGIPQGMGGHPPEDGLSGYRSGIVTTILGDKRI